jgi:hypothetical protein
MLSKARMKLNIKKLYSADGLAVKELLKLALLLHKARAQASQQEEVRTQSSTAALPVTTEHAVQGTISLCSLCAVQQPLHSTSCRYGSAPASPHLQV